MLITSQDGDGIVNFGPDMMLYQSEELIDEEHPYSVILAQGEHDLFTFARYSSMEEVRRAIAYVAWCYNTGKKICSIAELDKKPMKNGNAAEMPKGKERLVV